MEIKKINVFLWNKLLGVLAKNEFGYYSFNYDKKWLNSHLVSPSPLAMPLTKDEYVFNELPLATYKGLPALISDALPDDFGNNLINHYLSAKGIPVKSITALDRLAYIGDRGMGALTFLPENGPKHELIATNLNQLVKEANLAIKGSFKTETIAAETLQHLLDVGTSAGGARAKAVIGWNQTTQEIVNGQGLLPKDFSYWLLKFDGVGIDTELGSSQAYGRIEYDYYLMAKHSGINMSECRLLEENNRAHFMTKRFDRDDDGTRYHMQTLCAMAHLDYKERSTHSYEQFFFVLEQLDMPYKEKEEAFRRMVFNILTKNCDDHTKNISFLLKENENWTLAPAYDLTFAYNPQGEWTYQHLMSVNGKFKDFEKQDLLELAKRFNIGTAEKLFNQVNSAVKQWDYFAKQANVPIFISEEIKKHHLSFDEFFELNNSQNINF